MLKFIDAFLNKITMYRLVLYFLIILLVIALILCVFGTLHFSALQLLFSIALITLVCYILNQMTALIFQIPANTESVYITALILALIITPPTVLDWQYIGFIAWACAWAIASKFILAINRKHIFNPAAFGVAMTALTLNHGASWWVGTAAMAPFVLVGGLLVVRKIRRFGLAASFFAVGLATTMWFAYSQGGNSLPPAQIWSEFYRLAAKTSFLFFGFIMLTEPLTTPPTRGLQILYGGLVGVLFAPQIHIAGLYSTPELALLAGNVFSYLVSPKKKLLLKLKEKIQRAPTVYDFVFEPDQSMQFKPGQYMEWTLGHDKTDTRGNRRYFTVASSPSEKEISMGVKFYPEPSSFKKALLALEPGNKLLAGQLAGDFVLPNNPKKKLAFIAGGIGITPFRSMIKYLVDKGEKRDIVLFYSNKELAEVVYYDLFGEAAKKIGLKTLYTLTDFKKIPQDWQGLRGVLNSDTIAKYAPDYRQRLFYISGPQGMVTAFKRTLTDMGISRSHIKTDFFPGLV